MYIHQKIIKVYLKIYNKIYFDIVILLNITIKKSIFNNITKIKFKITNSIFLRFTIFTILYIYSKLNAQNDEIKKHLNGNINY